MVVVSGVIGDKDGCRKREICSGTDKTDGTVSSMKGEVGRDDDGGGRARVNGHGENGLISSDSMLEY